MFVFTKESKIKILSIKLAVIVQVLLSLSFDGAESDVQITYLLYIK